MFTLKYHTYSLTYCMPMIQYINKKLNRGQLLWPAKKWWWISHVWNVVISVGGIFFIERFVCCMTHEEKLNIFVTVISVALYKSFVCSKYTFSVSQFLLYWMWIICCIYKDFVWKLKAFLPSFCHSCACEMFPGASEGHFGSEGGNLNSNCQKSQMPRGDDVEASI